MKEIQQKSVNLNSYFFNAHIRHDMIKLMPEKVENVLEVGCGIGKTGQAIIEKKKSRVVGLDISPEAIELAKELDCYEKLLVCDLDKSEIPREIENEKFDCLLYPDVLEHLRDPWSILKSHAQILKDDGLIIASIPNIRYLQIIKNLLFKGDWTYQEMGILDRTHLRFFTRKTMIDLFESSGYRVTSITPRSLSGPKYLKWLNQLFSNRLEEFMCIQYLICADKKG